MTLSGKQRKQLRGLSHPLSPLVHVGRAGLSDAVVDQIEQALDDHELIKVKLQADREEREQLLEGIVERVDGVEVVGTIGGVVILYRRHPDPERRKVDLP